MPTPHSRRMSNGSPRHELFYETFMSHLAELTVRCWSDGGTCRMMFWVTVLAIRIQAVFAQQIFINEIHYDNTGSDVG
eukprot:437165-Pleurochrysis_carterae.AAC.1